MKQPKLHNLKIDMVGTRRIRERMRSQKVKITINVDSDTLSAVRELAEKGGMPYQTLLNRLLRETVILKKSEESRLARLEREVNRIKKELAA